MAKFVDEGYVDLDEETVRDIRGKRITEADAEARSAEVVERNKGGRPSLSGVSEKSPHIGFRVSQETKDALQERADHEGKTISQVAREALEAYVATTPPPGLAVSSKNRIVVNFSHGGKVRSRRTREGSGVIRNVRRLEGVTR